MAGDTPVEVGKVMITAAGRKAVERYPARMSPPPRCAISGPGPRNAPLYPALDQSVRFMFDPPHAATQSPNSRKRQSMPALATARFTKPAARTGDNDHFAFNALAHHCSC
jgi:hypothetical protein